MVRRSASSSRLLMRWLALGGLLLVVFLYYRPLRTYLATRHTLSGRVAEVHSLRAQRRALEQRLARVQSGAALESEARRLGLVHVGEHLYIVKGIQQWLRQRGATIGGGG